ncbi:hypothetical protein BOTNAR_0591g00050 [Botryotinia narcissicola]|uniref:BZIP domain-containing protein n=1 Tax=Botryotinia narcissicola TaxID=278944 RepID=A0A4Z1HMZ5_9HELO|nr:hypothetical protein BOTNAR_0591g00050 [Botryotinia narcissicola]
MSTAAEKANLSRIRDNQRRSRARRKEYLQELEARLRQSRRVADENKKLRSLLAQHGVGNEMVETFLQMSSEDLMISAQYGSESPSVQQLEQLLQARKLCCADGSIGPTSTITMGQTIQSRESSYSGNTVHSVWEPVQPSRSMSVRQTPTSTGKAFSQAQQFMSPRRSSAASRHSSISQNHSTAGTVHTRQQQQQQQRFNMTPISLPNSQQQNTPSSLSIQSPQIYEFESQYISNQSYNTLSPQTPQMHSHLQFHTNSNPNSRSSVSSHQISPPISSTYTNTPSENNGPNLNSCVFATDMITTMAGGDPAVVRAELGCVPGMDCNVDNQLVFHVMDRYTENGVGL